MEGSRDLNKVSATRTVASTLGVLVGLTGFEHGLFAALQGNTVPSSRVIEAIGPAQRFWEHGTEPAFTLVPNFLVTGILAMIVGLSVMIWSVAYIDRKHGAWGLALLSVALFLVGGGFAPLFLAILPVAAAAKINSPLTWWRTYLPPRLRGMLAGVWQWPLAAFVFLSLLLVVLAIFGYPFMWFCDADQTLNLMTPIGNITFYILGPIVLVTAFAYDILKQAD